MYGCHCDPYHSSYLAAIRRYKAERRTLMSRLQCGTEIHFKRGTNKIGTSGTPCKLPAYHRALSITQAVIPVGLSRAQMRLQNGYLKSYSCPTQNQHNTTIHY